MAKSPEKLPNEIRHRGERENQKDMREAGEGIVQLGPVGKVHVDASGCSAEMSDPHAGGGGASGVNRGCAADACYEEQADGGPDGPGSLTGGEESDCPADEHRGIKINPPADAKIDGRESANWDERSL